MKIRLEKLREVARVAVREALTRCPPVPARLRQELTLGVEIAGDERVFILYNAGERPEDALFIARAVLDVSTGEVKQVEVFPENWT
ncbi:hypothetical protein OV208_12590 [Corallococcus sp. bb12-1]|uniref:hypothetical protein n=1 Tax=Corallococcus sp. bb12-1 TaxID=2996784 RepID=UPI00226ED33C|nr:hypothetical protein [Corallococcus sp. bb12-1]MCY1042154.1 hypothetical protein [Corallococcus sp. bb12-1]